MVMPQADIEAVCAERPEAGAIIQLTESDPEIQRIGRALGVNYGLVREDAGSKGARE
jgi:hypothetical protein